MGLQTVGGLDTSDFELLTARFFVQNGQQLQNLFHQQEDVSLSSVQHVAMRMFKTFHRETHGPAINVDPARSTRSQEGPDHTHKHKHTHIYIFIFFFKSPLEAGYHSYIIVIKLYEGRVGLASSYLKMVSALDFMEEAVPHFSSSAASQKARFSPGKQKTFIGSGWVCCDLS